MRRRIESADTSFVLVTSPHEASVEEAFLFQDHAKRLGLPLGGFVFNCSSAHLRHREFPQASSFREPMPEALLATLQELATGEQQRAARDLEILRKVQARAGSAFVVDLPLLEDAGDEVGRLAEVATALRASAETEPRSQPGNMPISDPLQVPARAKNGRIDARN
jgi:hypothetical protein